MTSMVTGGKSYHGRELSKWLDSYTFLGLSSGFGHLQSQVQFTPPAPVQHGGVREEFHMETLSPCVIPTGEVLNRGQSLVNQTQQVTQHTGLLAWEILVKGFSTIVWSTYLLTALRRYSSMSYSSPT